jgi:branched-chain amino acid transport system ATP-binding protein
MSSGSERTDDATTAEPESETGAETTPDDGHDGLLVVDGVTKQFGGLTAVDDLSFTVGHGEILGFIGPNGAGKTTTFNCVMGTHEVTSGSIYYKGADITGLATHEIVNRGIARTFQTARPIKEFTVAQNIGFALMENRLFSLTRRSDALRNRVVEIAATVGFEFEDLAREPAELPHAGLLKLELARSLAVDPDLVLVDEVFAGLAAGEVSEFVDLFLDLREEGYTFIVIDHNMRGLLELIDRAVVLNFGEKIASGTPEQIKNDQVVQDAYFGGDGA